jgi:hypothetical protein
MPTNLSGSSLPVSPTEKIRACSSQSSGMGLPSSCLSSKGSRLPCSTLSDDHKQYSAIQALFLACVPKAKGKTELISFIDNMMLSNMCVF